MIDQFHLNQPYSAYESQRDNAWCQLTFVSRGTTISTYLDDKKTLSRGCLRDILIVSSDTIIKNWEKSAEKKKGKKRPKKVIGVDKERDGGGERKNEKGEKKKWKRGHETWWWW